MTARQRGTSKEGRHTALPRKAPSPAAQPLWGCWRLLHLRPGLGHLGDGSSFLYGGTIASSLLSSQAQCTGYLPTLWLCPRKVWALRKTEVLPHHPLQLPGYPGRYVVPLASSQAEFGGTSCVSAVLGYKVGETPSYRCQSHGLLPPALDGYLSPGMANLFLPGPFSCLHTANSLLSPSLPH